MRLMQEARREDLEVANQLHIDFDLIAAIAQHGLNAQELEAVYNTAITLSPKTIVEIGGASGVSSVLLATIAKEMEGKLFTVEPRAHKPKWQHWIYNLNAFGLMEYATIILAYSPFIDWTNLPFDTIDYLLIDGNHRGIAVMADFFMWSRYIPKGGRVAFHDCTRNPQIAKGIGMILETLPYKSVLQVDTRPGLWVIEKTGKTHAGETHGGKYSTPGIWNDCINHENQYNMTIDFDPIIELDDIAKIVNSFETIENEYLSDIGKQRQQIFCRLKDFDLTINIVIDTYKCVIMFSIPDIARLNELIDCFSDKIGTLLERNIKPTVLKMNVITKPVDNETTNQYAQSIDKKIGEECLNKEACQNMTLVQDVVARATEKIQSGLMLSSWDVLIDLLETFKFKKIAEIGVQHGKTSKKIVSEITLDRYLLVDPQEFSTVTDLAANRPEINYWNMPSAEAAPLVDDGSLELVYIDALHDAENVRIDINAWLPKIRAGGIICGDDYEQPGSDGVKPVVDEIFGDRVALIPVGVKACKIWIVNL